MTRLARTAAALCAAGSLAGLATAPASAGPAAAGVPAAVASPATTTTFGCRARQVLATMTLPQRLGQLFVAGTSSTAVSPATATAISGYHVGNVILMGRSDLGTAGTAQVTAALQARATATATAGVPLLVAADHEGGNVQPLRGPGFTRLPTALTMGTWSNDAVLRAGQTSGTQLRSAGVNVNLAPVLDTVPSAAYAPTNPPIGYWDREFGYSSTTVSAKGNAFRAGSNSAKVATAVKHFPGLGLVHANTDLAADVRDWVTTTTHPYLTPFRNALPGTAMVMMSSAYYMQIDRDEPAVFSARTIGLLRGWGYGRVVVSDDLGNAKAVAAWSPGMRAFKFLAAGGDLVLDVDPGSTVTMYRAMWGVVRTSAWWQARVNASALRVLETKESLGLLGPPC